MLLLEEDSVGSVRRVQSKRSPVICACVGALMQREARGRGSPKAGGRAIRSSVRGGAWRKQATLRILAIYPSGAPDPK